MSLQREGIPFKLYIGAQVQFQAVLPGTLNYVLDKKLNFFSLPLQCQAINTTPKPFNESIKSENEFTFLPDVLMPNWKWQQYIALQISTEQECVQKMPELITKQLFHASHLAVHTVILPLASDLQIFSQALNSWYLLNHTVSDIWISCEPNKFNEIIILSRMLVFKINIQLEIKKSEMDVDQIYDWINMPVQNICLYDTLININKQNQEASFANPKFEPLIQAFMRRNVSVTINLSNAKQLQCLEFYYHLLSDQFQKIKPYDSVELYTRDYYDVLQSPLQPLMYNLESAIYDVFERDQIKYDQYEIATQQALLSLKENQNIQSPVIMVLGAGRGPLVAKVIQAAQKIQVNPIIYAIEKNEFAIPTLKYKNLTMWNQDVKIFNIDMRNFQPMNENNEKVFADIIISELLGSFGDNELSPECLYGAQRLLKPKGYMIPSQHTSYIQPVTSYKAWSKVSKSMLEIPQVSKLFQYFALSPVQEVWEFNHPLADTQAFKKQVFLRFNIQIKQDMTILHGFQGYFSTILFKAEQNCLEDVVLSIHPDTQTPTMCSWFPIFFPLAEPFLVKNKDVIELQMWRKNDNYKVWYEWQVTQYDQDGVTPKSIGKLHNALGKYYFIGQ